MSRRRIYFSICDVSAFEYGNIFTVSIEKKKFTYINVNQFNVLCKTLWLTMWEIIKICISFVLTTTSCGAAIEIQKLVKVSLKLFKQIGRKFEFESSSVKITQTCGLKKIIQALKPSNFCSTSLPPTPKSIKHLIFHQKNFKLFSFHKRQNWRGRKSL